MTPTPRTSATTEAKWMLAVMFVSGIIAIVAFVWFTDRLRAL